MGIRVASSISLVALISLGIGAPVKAGGYEFPGDGARAIGRGGAFAARADDPMAVVVNPAGLASLPGTQVWVTGHLATPTAPSWPAGWGQSGGERISYTEVCNEKSKRMTPIPSIAVTWRVSKKVGMGFALIPPNAELAQQWGGSSYTVTTDNGSSREYDGYVDAPPGSSSTPPGNNALVPLDNGQNLLPSSARYQLVERNVLLIYPTIAVGAKPFRWLQIGAAFGWGIANVKFVNRVNNGVAGEGANPLEGQADLHGKDWFAPRVSAAIQFIPHDNVDIVGVFRWDDSVRAKGDLDVAVPVIDNTVASGLNTLQGAGTLVAPRPWWFTVGVRYADRITPRPDDPDAPGRESGRVEDPMSNERWDVEADLVYENNSVVETLDVVIGGLQAEQGSALIPPGGINTTVRIGHHWQDQLSLRLGGDWNVMPGKLALRSGFSYETNGFTGIGSKTSKGGTIDFMPLQRFGMHLGLTGRIKRAELSGAFSYFWNTTHNNTNGGTEQIVVTPADGGAQLPGDTVNNGAFSSRIIVASLAFRYFFMGWGGRAP